MFFCVCADLLQHIDALADIASNSVVVLTRVKRKLLYKVVGLLYFDKLDIFVCFKNFTHEDSTGLYQVCL